MILVSGHRFRTLPDPFTWHLDTMISIWTYHDFRGYLSHRAGSLAWDMAYAEAMSDQHDIDDEIGERMRRWSGVVPDQGTVDLVLAAKPGMTWRMLVEGVRGAELVLFSRVEFKFRITVEGKGVVGVGEIIRRKAEVAPQRVKGRSGRVTMPAVAASSAGVREGRNL